MELTFPQISAAIHNNLLTYLRANVAIETGPDSIAFNELVQIFGTYRVPSSRLGMLADDGELRKLLSVADTLARDLVQIGARIFTMNLPVPQGVAEGFCEEKQHLFMRGLMAYEIEGDEYLMRFDVLAAKVPE